MPADQPTIVASSATLIGRTGTFGLVARHAIELAGVTGRPTKLCYIGTARGDDNARIADALGAGSRSGVNATHLALFPSPNVDCARSHILDQDVIWVDGGSVANLLAVWSVHGLGETLRAAWHAGVVLAGASAGSLCWSAGGHTDSYGPQLRTALNTLGFVPYGNAVHLDSEPTRRPAVHAAVRDRVLPDTHCSDDGVGLIYEHTRLVGAVSETTTGGAYIVSADGDRVVEQPLDVRRLR